MMNWLKGLIRCSQRILKFNDKVIVMTKKNSQKPSLDNYLGQLECGDGISDERDKYEAIMDKLRQHNTKVGYSIENEYSDLLDPEANAFEGVKTILLLEYSIEMDSPNYIEIVGWIDSALGSEAIGRFFVKLEIEGNTAKVHLE